jgi:hypothetical protein
MRWDRISLLIDRLQDDLIHQGWVGNVVFKGPAIIVAHRYFQFDAVDAEPTKLQQGTVRTNCLDNLDRTNVVQASFAKWMLNRQLQSLGILEANRSIDDYEPLSQDFRERMSIHSYLVPRAEPMS